MINIKINNLDFIVKKKITILEACKVVGISIPRFCYHESLSIAGNCRVCLVEIEGVEKPVASCLTEVSDNLNIYTDSPYVKKSRENVIESLLLNHPLDCPICDQAGECDLQDQAKFIGTDVSRFFFNKKFVEDKDCGPLIKTIMTRCINCTRCVRFGSEVLGLEHLGTLNRGLQSEIGGYISKFFHSELSGNVIDLCPVGALTSKSYAFKARPWELRVNENIDMLDSTGGNLYVSFKDWSISRILPKNSKGINSYLLSDKARFSYDAYAYNRLKNIYARNLGKLDYFKLNLLECFSEFDHIFKLKSFTNIVINGEASVESISFLKKIQNLYKGVSLYSANKELVTGNLHVSDYTDPICSFDGCSDLCLIFSLNPKVECSLLNARLRLCYLNNKTAVYAFGNFSLSNIPTSFISLGQSDNLSLFEGKFVNVSKLLVSSNSPIIMVGESFRFSKLFSLFNFLKKLNNSVNILLVGHSSNSSGLRLLNIKGFNYKVTKPASSTFAIQLDDLFNIRKSFLPFKDSLVWFNSHYSFLSSKARLIIPVLVGFENSSCLINLEERPQIASSIPAQIGSSYSLISALKSLFCITNMSFQSAYLNFLFEIGKHPEKFNSHKQIFSKLTGFKLYKFKSSTVIKKYPLKPAIEDFYCSNQLTKNSMTMIEASKRIRKLPFNFNL